MDAKSVHSFSVLAYKESPYIEEAIQSLKNQSLETNIYVCTSTPSKFLEEMCQKYDVSLHVNVSGKKGVASDYDFAFSTPKTPYVTLVHQDDIYLPNFAKATVEAISTYPKSMLLFSDYLEVDDNAKQYKGVLIWIKKFLLFTNYGFGLSMSGEFRKRFLLALSNPICSPSVTFNRELIGEYNFPEAYRFTIDWAAWKEFSKLEGAFTYIPKELLLHRIHPDTETALGIQDNRRFQEDLSQYREYWPEPVAQVLSRLMSISYRLSNA